MKLWVMTVANNSDSDFKQELNPKTQFDNSDGKCKSLTQEVKCLFLHKKYVMGKIKQRPWNRGVQEPIFKSLKVNPSAYFKVISNYQLQGSSSKNPSSI